MLPPTPFGPWRAAIALAKAAAPTFARRIRVGANLPVT